MAERHGGGRGGLYRGLFLGQAAVFCGLGWDSRPLGDAAADGADVGTVPGVRLRAVLRFRYLLAL